MRTEEQCTEAGGQILPQVEKLAKAMKSEIALLQTKPYKYVS
jgi:hypothetical protein